MQKVENSVVIFGVRLLGGCRLGGTQRYQNLVTRFIVRTPGVTTQDRRTGIEPLGGYQT